MGISGDLQRPDHYRVRIRLDGNWHDGGQITFVAQLFHASDCGIPRIQGGTFVSAYQINAQLTGQAGDAAPEPATWTLFGAAAIFLGGIRRLKSN